jgi:hypothetical protein
MFGSPIGDVKLYMILKNLKVYPFLTLVVWACRVDRCANILAHQCPSPPIGNGDQAQCANKNFFVFRSATPIGAGVHRFANSIGGL